MAAITLSADQEECKEKALRWFNSDPKTRKPWFRIEGGAGMGKTTLIKAIVAGIEGVQFVAPTGKAALVLSRKVDAPASTVHKKIYSPKGNITAPDEELRQARDAYAQRRAFLLTLGPQTDEQLQADSQLQRLGKHLENLEAASKPCWKLNEGSELAVAKLLVLSEGSMVPDDMALDLLRFKVPILVEGDSGQLPPVFGRAYFMRGRPDFTLTTTHRQHRDSPILAMARKARMGTALRLGDWGDGCAVVKKVSAELALQADQIIVGRNRDRHRKNHQHRLARGFLPAGVPQPADFFVPRPGEKLICLRNDNELGIMNGELFKCRSAVEASSTRVAMEVESEDDPNESWHVRCHSELFKGPNQSKLPAWALQAKGVQQFDFGYVITCHKSQGSEWPFVIVYDQSKQFADWRAWLYTALTRAAKRLIVVQCDDN
jgi:exodeoxyribonuclease-5